MDEQNRKRLFRNKELERIIARAQEERQILATRFYSHHVLTHEGKLKHDIVFGPELSPDRQKNIVRTSNLSGVYALEEPQQDLIKLCRSQGVELITYSIRDLRSPSREPQHQHLQKDLMKSRSGFVRFMGFCHSCFPTEFAAINDIAREISGEYKISEVYDAANVKVQVYTPCGNFAVSKERNPYEKQ